MLHAGRAVQTRRRMRIESTTMDTFDIYFLGEMLPGVDPAEVRAKVAGLFKIQEDAADRLFTGKPLRVKQGLDVDKASRYRAAFREAGALLQIVPHGSPPPAARPAEPSHPAGAPAPERAAAATDDTPEPPSTDGITVEADDFDLAEPGATIDETPPPSPVQIDTGGLEALPANSGSLEDCKIEKPPHPIPDISHLKLVDD